MKMIQKITDLFLILQFYWNFRTFAKVKCQHPSSKSDIIFVYEISDWKDCDNGQEINLLDLKCKCNNCGEIFIKRAQYTYRNKFTKEFEKN